MFTEYEVDDQLVLRRLLDRKVARLGPFEDLVDEDGGPPGGVSDARRVVHESTGLRPTALGADKRHAVL